jgi:hypothetical protein
VAKLVKTNQKTKFILLLPYYNSTMTDLSKYASKWTFLFKKMAYWAWFVLAALILLSTQFPDWVGRNYTHGFFKWLSYTLRTVSSQFPKAIGEYLYLFILIMLFINIIRQLIKYKIEYKHHLSGAKLAKKIVINAGIFLLHFYVLFMLVWGLNYQQASPAKQFGLEVKEHYDDVVIEHFTLELIDELNAIRAQLTDSALKTVSKEQILVASIQEYEQVSAKYPFLKMQQPCLKFSRYPFIGDYLGFMAFYHPLTGEAIIRGDLPLLTLPYTTCHEIAHQLGYASETEANFIAFVVGAASNNKLFKYSMLLELFSYAQSAELNEIAKSGNFENWKKVIERNKKLLSPLVLSDRKKIKIFFLERRGLLIPASTSMYNQFLQWNKQAKGIQSYDDVLLWALAYRAK